MSEQDLPPDVLEALHAGRKIEAIKLLRERRGLGLKEAKQTVERYSGAHPERLQGPSRAGASSGSGWLGLVLLVVLALAIFGLGSLFGAW